MNRKPAIYESLCPNSKKPRDPKVYHVTGKEKNIPLRWLVLTDTNSGKAQEPKEARFAVPINFIM